jgi:hypothetical protein
MLWEKLDILRMTGQAHVKTRHTVSLRRFKKAWSFHTCGMHDWTLWARLLTKLAGSINVFQCLIRLAL